MIIMTIYGFINLEVIINTGVWLTSYLEAWATYEFYSNKKVCYLELVTIMWL